ncbi:acetyl-CoA synthetase-like protein [Xylariaceae sp. FL0594]|nr:acetyl-CoA synthetase-like protein [Xylariaceae sp. FL0594]
MIVTSPPVLVDHPGEGIVRITLNRPHALNAISVGLLDGLVSALRAHQDARVILLEGAGDRSFCAGEDLKQTLAPRTQSAAELRESFEKLQDVTRLTSGSRAVVVAAVQGFAIGGGAEIALAADFVVGGPGARIRFPEVTLGHAATGGITLRLTSMVGLLKAKELLMLGRWVGADEALRLGLLTEVAEKPKERALELAGEIAGLPAAALSASKQSVERFADTEACLRDEVNVASYCFAQSDAERAFANFRARKSASAKESKEHRIRDINAALDHAVKSFPHRTFIRFGGKDVSFGQFEVNVAKLAGGLRDAGVKEGDRVVVMMRNGVEMVCSWLATNRIGAVWVPINVELRSITLQHVVKTAQPKVAIADEIFSSIFRELGIVAPENIFIHGGDTVATESALSSLLRRGTPVTESVKVMPHTTAAFLFTSGTTSKSKACMLSHEYFILQAQALIDGCGLDSSDVLYCPFPLFHADATALTTMPALLLGAVAALSPRLSASRFWDEIREAGATVYDFMGATLALTYKQPASAKDRDHRVRLAWGVPIPSFAPDYEARFGHRLVTLYGSVEAALPIFQAPDRELPAGSCGVARPGFQVRIADDAGEEVGPDVVGNLLLRSDAPNAFFAGYFGDEAQTARAFRGTWFHTGDLARVDAAGSVYFAGRARDVIRRRGENVNACEVEDEFVQHPNVVVAAAIGIPSSLGEGTEEEVKVVAQMSPGSVTDEETLWRWAVERMARFQVPSVIEFVAEFEKTPTGKIEKHKLRKEGGKSFDIRSMSV